MRRIATLAAALVLAGGLGLAGCASTSGKKSASLGKPVNATCPVGKDPVGPDATLLASHKGQTVAFCCEGCVEMWATWTDAQRDEALASVMKK
jgi:hypothetical protein